MTAKPSKESYSEEETQRRFEELVKAALNTKPKPLAEITRDRRKAQPAARAKKGSVKRRP